MNVILQNPLYLFIVTLFVLALTGLTFWILKGKFLYKKIQKEFQLHLPYFNKVFVDPFEIFYVKQGQGPVVIFLHGIGASTYTWRFQIEELSKEFTVIALDLPGFGQSSKVVHWDYDLDTMTNILLKFFDALKVSQAFLVGSSMGGTLALNLARVAPHRFKKIAVLAPATDPRLVPQLVDRLHWTHRWVHRLLNETVMSKIMALVHANPDMVNGDSIKNYFSPYSEDPSAILVFLKATSIMTDKRLPKLFQSLPAETLLLYGEKDKMVKFKYVKKISSLLNTPIISHPNAGHHPQEDESEWVNQQLKNFFHQKI